MKKLTKTLKFSFVLLAAAFTAQVTYAAPSRFMDTGRTVKAPLGHVQFCRENSNACKSRGKAAVMKLTEARWNQLIAINDKINRTIRPVTDQELYGVTEYWTYAKGGAGDCEEYVLEKQRALAAAGWPKSALLITVVKDMENAGHAVLTVRTDQGDMILDNQIDAVLPWYATPYRYIKRQSETSQVKWTQISDKRVTTVASIR